MFFQKNKGEHEYHKIYLSDKERSFLTDLIQMERFRFRETSMQHLFPDYESMTERLLNKMDWT